MDSLTIVGLVNNTALLLSFGLAYAMLRYMPRYKKPYFHHLLAGIVLGLIGIAIMVNPWKFSSGVIFDTRSVLLSVAGFFFGPAPTLLAVVMTSAFRILEGGSGTFTGVAVIVTSAGIGLAWRRLRGNAKQDPNMLEMYLLGLAVHVAMLLWMFTLPGGVAIDVLSSISLPVMLIFPAATAILGKLMLSIGERRESEHQLWQSQETLAAALASMSDAIFISDIDGRFVDFNDAFATFHRFKSKAECAKTFDEYPDILDVFMVDGTPAPVDMWAVPRALRGESGTNIDYTLRRKDTGETWVGSYSFGPIHDQSGAIVGSVVVARDITERKRAETALMQSERKFHDLFKKHTAVKLLVDPDGGDIVDANEAAAEFYGWPLEELKRMRMQDITALSPEQIAEQVADAEKNQRIYYEFRHRLADNSVRDVAVYSSPIEIEGRYLRHRTVHDITAQRTLEAQLRQAQRMESVGRLAGGVAHDFNNMLNVILGYAELALDSVPSHNPLHANLTEIMAAAKRSAGITRQLLAFARRQTVAPKVLDLNATVSGMIRMLRRLIGEDIDLAWLPMDQECPVKMDPSQVDQILANLCVNARDAIADVGKITIETGMVTFDEAYCANHRGFVPGEFAQLVVSDDGSGMDKATLERIFEPFFTTKGNSGGTGLGLATVYGIVKQNGGFINVYSEPEQGTTFRIYLPRHADKAAPKDTERTVAMAHGRGETLLLVEDDRSIRKMGQMMLERLGYEVLAAATPGEAMHLAEVNAGHIDLLVTDVVMPEMNGRDLSDRLQAMCPNLKVLFMSGYTANVIAHQGVLDEGINFIQKPFSLSDLAGKVDQALNRPPTTA